MSVIGSRESLSHELLIAQASVFPVVFPMRPCCREDVATGESLSSSLTATISRLAYNMYFCVFQCLLVKEHLLHKFFLLIVNIYFKKFRLLYNCL